MADKSEILKMRWIAVKRLHEWRPDKSNSAALHRAKKFRGGILWISQMLEHSTAVNGVDRPITQWEMMGIGDKVDVPELFNVKIDDVAMTATFHPAAQSDDDFRRVVADRPNPCFRKDASLVAVTVPHPLATEKSADRHYGADRSAIFATDVTDKKIGCTMLYRGQKS